MGAKSGIEWTDASWTPMRGTEGKWHCVKVSRGCKNCYSETLNIRWGGGRRFVPGADTPRLDEKLLVTPFAWQDGRRVFVNAMTDTFLEAHPTAWLDRLFAVMALTPRHTYQVLTKRPERMREYLTNAGTPTRIAASVRALLKERGPKDKKLTDPLVTGHGVDQPVGLAFTWPLVNVWVGTTLEDQRYSSRLADLRATPAVRRFISAEPLLSHLDLAPHLAHGLMECRQCGATQLFGGPALCFACHAPLPHSGRMLAPAISWVITGGESSGPPSRALVERCTTCADWEPLGTPGRIHCLDCADTKLRLKPSAKTWLRSIRDVCLTNNVAYFHKQHGGRTPKAAGNLLDGRRWLEFPPRSAPQVAYLLERGYLTGEEAEAEQDASQREGHLALGG